MTDAEPTETTGSDPQISHVPERQRFEIAVDGSRAGLAAYVEDGERRIFHHTEVDDAYEGRGLAGQLVREALTRTRDDGRRIVAVCPYVARWLSRHADEAGLADAVDPVTPQALDTVRRAVG